jgi:hypothetical protein
LPEERLGGESFGHRVARSTGEEREAEEVEEVEEEGGGLELSNPYRITAASTNDVPRLKSIEIWKRAEGEDVGWNYP